MATANNSNPKISIYDAAKDSEFLRLYNPHGCKSTMEWIEAVLRKEGDDYMLSGYLDSCDSFERKTGSGQSAKTDYKWEFQPGLYSMQFPVTGEKSNDFLVIFAKTIEEKAGLDKPFCLTVAMNSISPQTLVKLTDPETKPEFKEVMLENAIPVLSSVELDKLKDKKFPAFSKGKSNSSYGGGVNIKSLSPSEKWDSVKPLLTGLEGTETMLQASKSIATLDAKQKEVLLSLIASICQ